MDHRTEFTSFTMNLKVEAAAAPTNSTVYILCPTLFCSPAAPPAPPLRHATSQHNNNKLQQSARRTATAPTGGARSTAASVAPAGRGPPARCAPATTGATAAVTTGPASAPKVSTCSGRRNYVMIWLAPNRPALRFLVNQFSKSKSDFKSIV